MSKRAPHFLILGYVWPEPESSAAGRRDWNLIGIFRRMGASITYASACRPNDFSRRLSDAGIETVQVRANDSEFDRWIAARRFDIVIFDRFVTEEQFGWRVREHSPASRRIVDTQDLHFLRRARQKAAEAGASLDELFSPDRVALHTEDAFREIASILRSDGALIISDQELRLLRERFGIPDYQLFLLPLLYPEGDPGHPLHQRPPGFRDRTHFAVIGNFRHPPNADGTRWLRRKIWPRIRAALPDAEVHVHGAYPSRELMELSSPSDGFLVRGPVECSLTMLRTRRVNLAPLRFGAGMKGKIADGWVAGAPVVTTPIGAEGMTLLPGAAGEPIFGGAIARDEEEFAQRAASLYTEERAWLEAHARGERIIRERLGFQANADALAEWLLRPWPLKRDRHDFTLGMLNYHSYRSAKYFSRWIEKKNAGRADI